MWGGRCHHCTSVGQWHIQVSLRSILVGSCTQSRGLEGLAHVADEELPAF